MCWVYPGDQLYMPSLYVYNRCHCHPFKAYIRFFISTNLLFLRKYSYFYLHACDCHSSFRRISILYILSPRNRWYTWNLSLKTAYFGNVPTSRTLRKALYYDKKILFGHMFVAVLGRVVSRLLIPNSCHSRRILKAALEGRRRKQWGRKARLGWRVLVMRWAQAWIILGCKVRNWRIRQRALCPWKYERSPLTALTSTAPLFLSPSLSLDHKENWKDGLNAGKNMVGSKRRKCKKQRINTPTPSLYFIYTYGGGTLLIT